LSDGVLADEFVHPQEVTMTNECTIKLHIAFNDPDLDAEEREEEVQKLLHELKQLDEVDEVDRVLDPCPPEGNKALGGYLVGMLMAQVDPSNIIKFLGFLRDRLSGRIIELQVEANGKKLHLKAGSRAEFLEVMAAAQQFVAV
jgi:hypothetical protein